MDEQEQKQPFRVYFQVSVPYEGCRGKLCHIELALPEECAPHADLLAYRRGTKKHPEGVAIIGFSIAPCGMAGADQIKQAYMMAVEAQGESFYVVLAKGKTPVRVPHICFYTSTIGFGGYPTGGPRSQRRHEGEHIDQSQLCLADLITLFYEEAYQAMAEDRQQLLTVIELLTGGFDRSLASLQGSIEAARQQVAKIMARH